MEKLGDLFKRRSAEKSPKKTEKEKAEGEEELPPNVKAVETKKGKFRIAYNAHYNERKPEELGNGDAWILESSGIIDYTLPKNQSEEQFEKFKKGEGIVFGNREYKMLFEKAEKEKKPIFLVDVAELGTEDLLDNILDVTETMVGLALLVNLMKDLSRNKKMTRREFLAKAVGGSYLASKTPNNLIKNLYKPWTGRNPDEKKRHR